MGKVKGSFKDEQHESSLLEMHYEWEPFPGLESDESVLQEVWMVVEAS